MRNPLAPTLGAAFVAIDHGVCNEPSYMVGLEDMAGVMDTLISATVLCGHYYNLFMFPDEPDLFRQCVENISRVRSACHKHGMPLMIEPLVMLSNDVRGGYQVDGNAEKIVTLTRLASEMGADIIKADPTENPEDFHRVVEAARVPVLVRGGGKEDLKTVLARSAAIFAQVGTVLLCKDFITYSLTGERVSEVSDMSGCGLTTVPDCTYDDEGIARMTRVKCEFLPKKNMKSHYDARYQTFLALTEAM